MIPGPAAAEEPGDEVWSSSFDGAGGDDRPTAQVVSPDGTRLYVTGYITSESGDPDFAVVAYDTETGAEVWSSTYDGPPSSNPYYGVLPSEDRAYAIAVSLDGAAVYVTGSSDIPLASFHGGTTIAYDAPTGTQEWVASDLGGAGHFVGVSAGGTRVIAAGGVGVVAYDPADGGRVWANYGVGGAARLSPNGERLYLASSDSSAYITAAVATIDGEQLWVTRTSSVRNFDDRANAITVSPDGTTVYVTGRCFALAGFGFDYFTVALEAESGTLIWSSRYDYGVDHIYDEARSIAANPDGSSVYVTGVSWDNSIGGPAYATVAYNAQSGAQVWVTRQGSEVAMSQNGAAFFGELEGAVNAYETLTGSRTWSVPGGGIPATGPDGSRLYTASVIGPEGDTDFAITAYETGLCTAADKDGPVSSITRDVESTLGGSARFHVDRLGCALAESGF